MPVTATSQPPSAASAHAPPRLSFASAGTAAVRAPRARDDPSQSTPLFVVGALMIAGAAAAFSSGIAGTGGGIRPALLMLVLTGATSLVGGFVGFLFGLPRFDYAAREAAAKSLSNADAAVAFEIGRASCRERE